MAKEKHAETVEALAKNHTVWDRLGILGSAICLIHCLALPLVVGAGALSSVGGLSFLAHGNGGFHQVLAIILLAVALFAFIPGFRHHGNRLVLAGGISGISLLLFVGFILDHHLGHEVELGLTVLASTILLAAHLANWRLCARRKEVCCDS